MFKKSLIAVASLLAAVGTAQACSTLVIGKAVSETGNTSSPTTKTTAAVSSTCSTMFRPPSTRRAKC